MVRDLEDDIRVAKALLRPPNEPPASLARNVVNSLQDHVPSPAVVVLQAGCGFGKTTLLRQLFARRSVESPCLWVTLPNQSVSIDLLYAYLRGALLQLGRSAEGPVTADLGGQSVHAWANWASNILLDQRCGLCIDLAGCELEPQGQRMVDQLLALATSDAPVYIASRPEWKSAELQGRAAAGDAVIVPAAELLFSNGEVREYLAESRSLMADQSSTTTLYESTFGWPMGVAQFAEAMAGMGVAQPSRVQQIVLRQIAEWLAPRINELSANTISTLRALLVIDEFDEEIMDRVALSRRPAQTLDRLLSSDLPIVYRITRQSWSFPPIVRDALVRILDVRRHGRRWRESLKEMTVIYRRKGRSIDEADAWTMLGEPNQAAEALNNIAREAVAKRRLDTLIAVGLRLSDELVTRQPVLGVYRAIASGANLAPQQDTANYYERASKLINETGQAEDISVLVPRWADFLTAAGQTQPADEAVSRLLVRVASHPYIRARLTLSQARISLFQGEIEVALGGIDEALSITKAQLDLSELGRASEWRVLGSILGGHTIEKNASESVDSVQRRARWLAPLIDWLVGDWRSFEAARLPNETIEPGLERSAIWLKHEQSGRAGHLTDGREARRNIRLLENAGDLVTAALSWAALFRARARGQLNLRPPGDHLSRLLDLIDVPFVRALCRLSLAAHLFVDGQTDGARNSITSAATDLSGTDCRALSAATKTLELAVGGPAPESDEVEMAVRTLPGLLWSFGPLTVVALARAVELNLATAEIRRLLRRQPALSRQFRRVRSLSASDESERLAALLADQTGVDEKALLEQEDESAPVYARTFGPLSLEVNGTTLEGSDWRSGKTKQILALLLLHRGTAVPRDEIINMVWPGSDQRSGSNNLKFCWSILKRLLEPGLTKRAESSFLRRGPAGYELLMDAGLRTDADIFGKLLVKGRWSGTADDQIAAISLFKGEYLAGLPADAHIDSERDRYRSEYIAAVMRALNHFGDHGQLAEAKSLVAATQQVLIGRPELGVIEDRLARWEQGF